MPTINIEVKNKAARQTNKSVYVCGNSDFVVVFDFDAEWGEHSTKTARFKYNGVYQEVIFTGNECPMPMITNTVTIHIGVYAGDLHTTTAAVIFAKKSILCGGGTQYVPPDLYTQIMSTFEDISARLDAIEKALENGGGNDDEGGGEDEGDGPDNPVITKLAAPTIYLETVEDPGDDDTGENDANTPAILGLAVLGRTILGDTGGITVRLPAPVIRLETVTDPDEDELLKLTTPAIRIETEVDPGRDEGGGEKLPKLTAPVIQIETEEDPGRDDGGEDGDGENEPPQLAAPVINLETVVLMLDAPAIQLVEG